MRLKFVGAIIASLAIAGCGTKSALDPGSVVSASSTGPVSSVRIDYDQGLYSYPAPSDASAPFSRAQVEDYLVNRPGRNSPETPGTPGVDLRLVTQNGIESLKWVVVWHHSKLTSRGPAGSYPNDSSANCDMILMLDAESGAFSTQVQLCAPPPAGQALIDAGKVAPPLYSVAASSEPLP